MTDPNGNINRDERALEAFVAAAFQLDFPESISDEQARLFFQQPARLSKEDEEIVDSWGRDFIEDLIQGQTPTLDRQQEEIIEVNEELEQEYFAMNRDRDSSGLDEETLRRIEEERKKALEEEDEDTDRNNES